MNYWLLTTEYPPLHGGGISTYCYHTACMLSEKGHSVTVFINDKTVNSIKIEKLPEAKLIRFNPSQTKSHSFLGHDTNISYEFAHIVKTFIEKEGKPDIIESQDYNGIAYFLLQSKYCLSDWCRNIPVIITTHSPSFLYMEYNEVPMYKKPNFWIGEMERFCIQAADLLISPSNYLIDELKQRFTINNKNLHIIANPYKSEIKNNTIDKSLSNNNITFYGKLSPQKGTFKILELFQFLWDKGLKKQFLMIGDQEIVYHPLSKTMGTIIKKKYAKYIKKGLLKLERKINPSEIENYLSSFSIFIIPSIVDNLPYAALELMANGKILIVSKSGGQAEIISNNEDGFIFDYSKKQSFETILNKVINLTIEERKNISQKAIKKIAQNYSYDKIYGQKIKLIESLINENKKQNNIFPFIRKLPIKLHANNTYPTTKEKLSVIIPYYNLGKYINETIISVLKSSFKNIEVLIINDGSTDLISIKKLNRFRNHKIISVIDKPNTGLADTRNYGVNIAKGEFIAFLDADDKVEKTYYEKAIKILSTYENVDFVGAWTNYFGNSKKTWPTFNPEPPIILTHNTINSSALVYKKDSFLNFGKNDANFKIGLEDYDSVVSMLSNGQNGVAIPEKLFYYRVRNKSMIKGVTNDVRKNYYSAIVNKYPDLFSKCKNEVKKLIDTNSPPLQTDNSTLDALPFNSIPLINKMTKTLINTAKSNPKLKKYLLMTKKALPKI